MQHVRRSRSITRPSMAILACFGMLVAMASAAPADILDSEWAGATSTGLSVIGPISQRQARELAVDLELFRQVVVVLTGVERDRAGIPTQVLAVEDDPQWSEIGLPGAAGGLFIPTWRGNLVALKDHDDPLHLAAVKHAYVHFLIAKPARRDVPLWYEEGFADLLSTVQMKRDRVAVGLVPDWVEKPLATGSWIPVRKLIDPGDLADATHDQNLMFRAQSWALVHYLMVGGEYKDSFTSRLAAYMQGIADGTESTKAFEEAFEVDLAILDQALHRYVERKRLPALALPLDRFSKAGEIRASRPSKSEVALAIGRLRAALHEDAGARVMFERAIALDPANARAHAAQGVLFASEQLRAEGQTELERAAVLAPDDATIQLDLAAIWLDRAATQTDATRRAADVATARSYLGTAWKLDQGLPETYASLGWSHVILRDDPARAVELLEGAERSLASDVAIQLLLADAYLASGRDEDAVTKLRAVAKNPHASEPDAKRAREQLAALAARKTGEGGAASTSQDEGTPSAR